MVKWLSISILKVEAFAKYMVSHHYLPDFLVSTNLGKTFQNSTKKCQKEISEFANRADQDKVAYNEPPHLKLPYLPSSLNPQYYDNTLSQFVFMIKQLVYKVSGKVIFWGMFL